MASFLCPTCQFSFTVASDLPPQTVRCPECDHQWSPNRPPPPPNMPPLLPPVPPSTEAKPAKKTPIGVVRIVGKFVLQCLNCGDSFNRPFKHRTRLSRREANDEAIKQIVKDECGQYEQFVCPECGSKEPCVAGRRRKTWDTVLGIVGFCFCAFMSLAVLSTNTPVGIQWANFGIAVIVLVGAIITGAVIKPQLTPRDDSGVTYEVGKRWPSYALYGIAVFFLLISPVWRTVAPLPRNHHCDPSVIVANKPIRVKMPCTFKAYGGHWSGRPTVRIMNPNDFQPLPKIIATTHTEGIRTIIETKTQQYAITPDTYIDLTFPDEPQLRYRPVQLKLYMTVDYPMPVSETTFLYTNAQIEQDIVVTMVPATAARTEMAIGLIGAFLGVLALGAGAFWLNRVNNQLVRIHFPRKIHIDEIESRDARD